MPGQGAGQSTLQARDFNSDGAADAFYDTVLNVTWLADANASAGSTYDSSGTDCGYNVQTISPDGQTVYSEMAHLFHITLGNLSGCNSLGDCSARFAATAPDRMLSNAGEFRNLQVWAYWTDVAYAPTPTAGAWIFDTCNGYQGNGGAGEFYALAVLNGDVVTAVPEPQTVVLMLLGLGAVVAAQRRRATTAKPKRDSHIVLSPGPGTGDNS